MLRKLLVGALTLLVSTSAFAQSQAINGLIEGVVKDSTGGVLPGVNVTVTNTTTGESKTYVTDSTGQLSGPPSFPRLLQGPGRTLGLQGLRARGLHPLRGPDTSW